MMVNRYDCKDPTSSDVGDSTTAEDDFLSSYGDDASSGDGSYYTYYPPTPQPQTSAPTITNAPTPLPVRRRRSLLTATPRYAFGSSF